MEKVEDRSWTTERSMVLYQLKQLEDRRKEDRDENREKFKTIFDRLDEFSKSISGVKMSTKILIALNSAVFLGMLGMLLELLVK